jgi:hypothetical protein
MNRLRLDLSLDRWERSDLNAILSTVYCLLSSCKPFKCKAYLTVIVALFSTLLPLPRR